MAKNKGTIESEMKKNEKCSLLILDDLFLIGPDARERSILMEIIEDRHGLKSIIITYQLPVESWYDAIGDPTVADGSVVILGGLTFVNFPLCIHLC